MEPLFEAKALHEDQYVLYHVFRVDAEKYKLQLITDAEGDYNHTAPAELVISKNDDKWQAEGNHQSSDLVATLGIEIDVFNNGYGALLGRIGVS